MLNFDIGVDTVIIPDTLEINFDYNLNYETVNTDETYRHYLGGEAEYTVTAPKTNRPGVALAIIGSMEDTDTNVSGIDEATVYQVYTVLRIKAPFAVGD